jgi:hypothetical protein
MVNLLSGEREYGTQGGTGTGRAKQIKFALELGDAFAKTGDTDAKGKRGGRFGKHVKKADTIILYFDDDGMSVADDANGGGRGAGVAVDVGKGFLNDAEKGEFEFFFEASETIGNVHGDREAAPFSEELAVGSDSAGQAGFLEQRGMQERGNEADFADRGGGQSGGRAEELLKLAIGSRDTAADFGEGHLQAGEGLGSSFVELTADAALLLGADGEQLVRKAAQIGLGVSQGGNITGDADHAKRFTGGIGQGGADSIKNADGTVGPGIGFGKIEMAAGADCGFEIGAKLFDVFELEGSRELFEARGLGLGRNSEQASQVSGPDDLSGGDIELPGSKLGFLLGVFEEALGGLEAGLGEALGGKVAETEHESGRFVAEVCGAVQVGGKPSSPLSDFDGEFKRSSMAGAEAAKGGQKKAGSRKSEEGGKLPAEKSRA